MEFLREKSEAFDKMERLCKRLQNEKGVPIVQIRSDHGKEFENAKFEAFYNEHGIKKEFSAPKTPQQNGMVEKKNHVIQEMARVMLLNKSIPQKFWAKAVNTLCHIRNMIYFQARTKKISYEIWKEKKPKVKYFRVFGSKCYILNDRENPGKFDAKSDKGIFLGYATNSQAYRVYNKRTKLVMESINVVIDDTIPEKDIDDDVDGPNLKKNEGDDNMSQGEDAKKKSPEKEFTPPISRRETRSTQGPSSPLTPPEVQPPISRDEEPTTSKRPLSRVTLNHPSSNIISDLDDEIRLSKGPAYSANHVTYNCYLAQFEPKKVEEALKDENWVESMHQELHQFVRNDV